MSGASQNVRALGLEPERRERAVVGAAARNAGAEQIRVREQVRGHERAVAVAADADALAVGHAQLDRLVDRRLGARHELLDVRVVGGFPGADDRHRRSVEHRVALRQEQQMRGAGRRT